MLELTFVSYRIKTLLVYVFFLAIPQVGMAQLPQDHAYQRTLQDYLGTLRTGDFEVNLQPLTAKPSYFNSMDDLYRTWLFVGYEQNQMMGTRGLRVGARHFTLDAIQEGGGVHMTVGKSQFMNAIATAFWADWDYPGNPHYGSRAVKLRAFVASAVDMMMQDRDHEQGHNRRSDFLGFQLIRWAYAYGIAKDELSSEVRSAYEQGLIKMFEKLEQWGPTGTHADMDMGALVGMLYAAKYVDRQDLSQRAHRYIDEVLDRHLADAGYIDHGSAYDAGYGGISLYFINWAAQLSEYPPLIEALQKMSKLKAYMTLPDPDGRRFSPFHSNPSSGADAPHDLWGPYYRDVGIAEFSDEATYLALRGGDKGIHGNSAMLEDLQNMLGYFHDSSRDKAFTTSSDETPGRWKHEHWIADNSLNATALYYKPGLYEKLKSMQNTQSPLIQPPFEREGTFTESFADKMLSVKRPTYGAIIFNDRLSWWTKEGQTSELRGFGGGNLSAFWTPQTGSVLLGGTRTGHNGGLDLADWRIWPVHALSGETADGQAFSSGLQREPEARYAPGKVSITGDLASTYSDPRGGLQAPATYQRVMTLKDNGVQVTTSVEAEGTDQVRQLYEVLPVYRRNAYRQSSATPTAIFFKVDGQWESAGTSFQTVSSVRLERFEGAVYIDFKRPVRIKLSPQEFYQKPDQQSGLQARNLMIDLLGSDGDSAPLTGGSVSYFLRSDQAPPTDWSNVEEEAEIEEPVAPASHSPN